MDSSWVPGASRDSDFSLANIPFGIITTLADATPHAAVAIGTCVLDLKELSRHASFPSIFPALAGRESVLAQPFLNDFAALGRPVHRAVRAALQDLLSDGTAHPEFLRDNAPLRERALLPQSDVQMHLPMRIGDYTDFYAGYHHAVMIGQLFRLPQNALQPNYTHLPVGYHGRASSVVVSGTPIRRPVGQILEDPSAEPKTPVTTASRRLDFELELGCLLATPNAMGSAVAVDEADAHIFGYVLLNDWSARDIQTWEYVPLGPFNSKNFGSTVSAWVVLADALEPFRAVGVENETPLQEYIREKRRDNVFDIQLQVDLTTPSNETATIGRTSARNLMWSFPQMIAHHTLGGCPLRTGDLLGSGTISGPEASQRGSLLEMTAGGKQDVAVSGATTRRFLEDGDVVTLRGFCQAADGTRVGFGECAGRVMAAAGR